MDIKIISIQISVDNKPYLVAIPKGSTEIILKTIQTLSDGELKLVTPPEGCKIIDLKE